MKILTVTDIHQSKVLYDQLAVAVRIHTPDVVALIGDFLDGADDRHLPLTKVECAVRLSTLPCREVLLISGNHEGGGWPVFAAAWRKTGRPLRSLHAEAFTLGPMVVVGFPCLMADDYCFIEGREEVPRDVGRWFTPIAKTYGPASRFLWLMHEPPTGTSLSKATGVLAGNIAWTAAIERFTPMLCVFGHDHETPLHQNRWHEKLLQTQCVNLGQKLDGPLHCCVIEAIFQRPTPSLPTSITVTAYPHNGSFTLADISKTNKPEVKQ